MILQLAHHHSKKIASLMLLLFYSSILLPAMAGYNSGNRRISTNSGGSYTSFKRNTINNSTGNSGDAPVIIRKPGGKEIGEKSIGNPENNRKVEKEFIGGPSQPEMSSFKSIGTDNMVNLFTGDFSYNIPLMDVGGYPVNIYYDGGIGPEQEASWVGLGWNINPGNINRNVRGVPDDFNGQDTMVQEQAMRANKTWGLGVGADMEAMGIKVPITLELGIAFNNQLGPALEMGLRGNVAHKMSKLGGSEKLGANVNLSIGMTVNSRTGTSFSANASLNGSFNHKSTQTTAGLGLSTGYNSRSGIKALNISEQHGFSFQQLKAVKDPKTQFGIRFYVDHGSLKGISALSTTISFNKPSYTPSLRMPVTNTAWSGRFQLGAGSFGLAADVEAEVYGQKAEVEMIDRKLEKPMVGYLYYQNAVNRPDHVMDFTRFNDREVTPNTPIISVPQYSYDVFSIQGEGTGGSIRLYRNDLGYVRDNLTISKDKNFSIGGDIDPPGHFGANFNTVKTPSTIGEWNNGNKLRNSIQFTHATDTIENVYFRNPGESNVIDPNRFAQVGATDLVRFVLDGSNQSPTVEAKLQSFNNTLKANSTLITLFDKNLIKQRNKRTQVTSFLTAAEAAVVGLDKMIKSYDNQTFLNATRDTLIYESYPRVDTKHKAHHISQVNVMEANGRRYVYGLPVYNHLQKDFTFSVDIGATPQLPQRVNISDPIVHSTSSPLLADDATRDGYVQISTTPANAHSFLLSGILSPDYVDVNNDGITEDDLGDAVKFNYTRIKNGGDNLHKWRSPLSSGDSAIFNAGARTEVKDDKAMISYGERESWYLQSIESKTMIAFFYVSSRNDGKGAVGQNGGIDQASTMIKKLDSIALFSKADIKTNHFNKAKPIKTVHFRYSYKLCQGTPDHYSTESQKGKLTLDSIFTSYNGKNRAFKNKYMFAYASNDADSILDNPNYMQDATDRWGTFKPNTLNPGSISNNDYPYSHQPSGSTKTINRYAGAWMLKKIIIPSGAQIEVNYESDDYAFVQDRRAAVMMKVVGFGSTSSYSAATNRLYPFQFPGNVENDYVFMRVPIPCTSASEVMKRYLPENRQLAFKLTIRMPKGDEVIPCYANFAEGDYGFDPANPTIIWVKMIQVGGKSPLSITALEFLRQQLPGQAFKGYDVSGEPGLQKVGDILLGMLTNLRDAFRDPINAFRSDGKAMYVDTSKSFVRLNDADGKKYGGGHRVESIVLSDNWNRMTRQYGATYGQRYKYTTTESFKGAIREISSGVASYEPSIGGEENPFQSIVEVSDKLPLGPTSYGAIEMPVMDAFFPAPVVGYSKVTVKTIKTDTVSTKKSRSGIGKQVTEFYTAKDFPVEHSYTPIDGQSMKEFHQASMLKFFNKEAYDFKALSQGFRVVTNDMHGKIKSQSSYAENDSNSRISYSENFYRNTGKNGAGDVFAFVDKDNGAGVTYGNMGIDVELMTDTREFSVKATSLEIQGQVDIFYVVIPFPVPTVWPVNGTSENIYRAVTTTKVVNYHAVLDSMVVIDKGSQVSTKHLAYDANTGEVLVTRTQNEFDKPIYNTSFPAYWAYNGMGMAYKNIDARFTGVNFSDGRLTNAGFNMSVFESGDELYIQYAENPVTGCDVQLKSGQHAILWVVNKYRNSTSLGDAADLMFVDAKGIPYTMRNVSFRIIRSGKRNMLDGKAATIASMVNPIATGKIAFDTSSKVISASAIEFSERWLTDYDVIKRVRYVKNLDSCFIKEIEDSTAAPEKNINPYRKGLLGVYRPYRSMVFYDSRMEYDTTINTNISENGFLKNFKPYWNFNVSSKLMPDSNSTQWVWNSRITKANARGLEIETQDALSIYTAAQYGYHKTLPVAIANNSRYNEMFAENFEDYNYGESINNTQFNYTKKHIDFRKLSNSWLVNTDTAGFKAHSGKYVSGINGGATAYLDIPIGQPTSTNPPALVFGKDTTKMLNNPGGNYGFSSIVPVVTSPSDRGTPYFGNSSFSMQIYPKDTIYGSNRVHYYTFYDTFYIQITTANTYNFTLALNTAYNNYGASIYTHSNSIWSFIYDEFGTAVGNFGLSQNGFEYTSGNFSVFLCPGIYKVLGYGSELYSASNNGMNYTSNSYSWTCTNSSSPDYKDLSTVNGCIFTKPIAGVDSMLNPLFSIPVGKKMLFSGWVRETCGDAANGIPCKEHTYTHSQLQLTFVGYSGSNVILNPTGPIIDGWQRYEGSFIAPAGAANLNLGFVNSGTGKMYLDDIRIHPYNANMKSYVYDPVNLRLVAELDANNYASFYEYDEEGTLIRTKVETREGIKTITETRSALQKVIR